MLFPNLIVLALAQFTHFNIIFEEYLGGVFLAVSVGLFVLAHKRRSPSTPWIYYCPVTLLLFSFVQFQNSLWGFQMAWYLVMLSFATAVFLLDRPELAGAGRSHRSCSYREFLFAAGTVHMADRPHASSISTPLSKTGGHMGRVRRHNRMRVLPPLSVLWAIGPFSVFVHAPAALNFFFFSLGAVVGNQATNPARDPSVPTIILGLIIFLVAIWVVLAHVIPRERAASGSPIGVALILFGLLFTIFITEGRAFDSPYEPRYTTYNLLILVGCYLSVINRLPLRPSSPGRSLPAVGVDSAGHSAEQRSITQDKNNDRPPVVWAVVGTVLMSVILSTGHPRHQQWPRFRTILV